MARPKGVETMEVVVPGDGKPKPQQTSVGTGSSTVMDCCPDRAAAISMLPLADDRISCDSCDKDIKYLCYIRCAECADEVDLCVGCFYSGAEPGKHKKTHSYRVMDKLQQPIYSESWTAAEELALADHTRKMGLGAWDELSDLKPFYRRKTAADLNARYLDTYLSMHGSVLPPHYLRTREDGTVEKVPIPPTHPERCPPELRGVKLDSREIRSRTIAELGTNPKFRYEPSWQALAKKEEAKKAARAAAAAAAAAEAGTTAGGDGKGAGVANGGGSGGGGGASSAGSDSGGGGGAAAGGGGEGSDGGGGAAAAAGEGGAEKGAAAKSKQRRRRRGVAQSKTKEEERLIQEWTSKLPGADLSVYFPLRGDFDHEHDNAAEQLLANMEFRKTDHASERQLKLDVIAVYNHRLDEREKRKKFVIDHNLLDYKKQSTQLSGKKRTKEDRELVAKLRPLARFSTPQDHEELIENLLLAKKMRMRIEQLQTYRQQGITTLAEGAMYEAHKRKAQEGLAYRKHKASASHLYDAPTSSASSNRDRSSRYSNRHKDGGASDGGDGGEESRGENLLDIRGAPGYEFLAPAEQVLCSQLHMTPGPYLTIKHAMIQECARTGCLKKNSISRLSILDVGRLNKMYDFFSTCGWVSDKEVPLDDEA